MNIFLFRISSSQLLSSAELLINVFLSDHSCPVSATALPVLNPCQYNLLPFLLPPFLTFLPSYSCSWHHLWATLTLRWLLLTEVSLPLKLPPFYSTLTPHLTATKTDFNSPFFLDMKWTTTENTESSSGDQEPSASTILEGLLNPHIHGYFCLGVVHVQSGHTSDFWEKKRSQFRHKSQTSAAKCKCFHWARANWGIFKCEWMDLIWVVFPKKEQKICSYQFQVHFFQWKVYICCSKQVQEFLKFYLIIYFASRHFKKLKTRQILARENVR